MKRVVLFLFLVFISGSLIFAQAPKAFKYQAIARDDAGNVLSNRNISVAVEILKGSPQGEMSYAEVHEVQTNAFGLINLEIGNGIEKRGELTNVDWSSGDYFISLAMDMSGGRNFKAMGVSQLLSVPYALYAEQSGDQGDRGEDYDWYRFTYNGKRSMATGITGLPAGYDVYGNVGIGTTNLTEKLTIAGNIFVQSGTGQGYSLPVTRGALGDLLMANGDKTTSWLTGGTAGQIIIINEDGDPEWVNPPTGGADLEMIELSLNTQLALDEVEGDPNLIEWDTVYVIDNDYFEHETGVGENQIEVAKDGLYEISYHVTVGVLSSDPIDEDPLPYMVAMRKYHGTDTTTMQISATFGIVPGHLGSRHWGGWLCWVFPWLPWCHEGGSGGSDLWSISSSPGSFIVQLDEDDLIDFVVYIGEVPEAPRDNNRYIMPAATHVAVKLVRDLTPPE
jgi:hypothetical protein